jgi:hypothetical protein
MVVSGSSAIFSRASASQFYLDIEQLTVMHFLDAARFRNVVGLLQANSAYSIITDPQNLRPRIALTPEALAECDRLSCNLHQNIYGGAIKESGSVHSFATGIGSTSQDGTRDWLLNNVLQATDDYSRDLATNMTTLVRRKYDVDDRVRKAWYIVLFQIC